MFKVFLPGHVWSCFPRGRSFSPPRKIHSKFFLALPQAFKAFGNHGRSEKLRPASNSSRHLALKSLAVTVAIVVLVCGEARAGAAGDARKANKFYREKDYDKALELYDKALTEKPDDQKIQYNRAATLYRKKKFNEASQGFLRSLAGEDESIEEKAIYNAGNSEYRIGEASEKKDLAQAIADHKKALEYYKKAMGVSPDDIDAKYNYEFTLKKIRELEKQKEEQQQQDQQKDQQKQQEQQQQKDQQQQDEQQDQQKQQQQEQQQEQKEKERKEQEQKEQEQQEEQQKEEEERQRQQQQEQQQREKERQEEQERQRQQEEQDRFPMEQKPDKIDEFEGEMSEREAEMLLRSQDEEESRMRAEMKKARKAKRPPVVRDW
ncbi:MAG: tetratricopeptide repeat protein [Candidatus Omnitrophota bacterium]